MAADLEEMVEHADLARRAAVLPDAREHVLEHVARRHPHARARRIRRRATAGSARRSTLPLALSGSDGSQTIERRQHVVGQERAQLAPEIGRRRRRTSARGPRRRRSAASRWSRRAARRRGLAHLRQRARSPPRSRRARCGGRAPSPAGRAGRGTRSRRRRACARDRRCGTAAAAAAARSRARRTCAAKRSGAPR